MDSIARYLAPVTAPRDWELRNLMARLGMSAARPWVRITSLGPVAPADGGMAVELYGAVCRSYLERFPQRELARWAGYEYLAVGVVALPGRLAKSDRYWLSVEDGDVTIVQLWYQRVQFAGSPLSAVLQTRPERRAAIEGMELRHNSGDEERALKGSQLLLSLEWRGRRRLGEAELRLARRGLAYLEKNSWATLYDAVDYLKLVDEDTAGDRLKERRAREAARRRLAYWIQRLRDLEAGR
jgi:hypothetical protein